MSEQEPISVEKDETKIEDTSFFGQFSRLSSNHNVIHPGGMIIYLGAEDKRVAMAYGENVIVTDFEEREEGTFIVSKREVLLEGLDGTLMMPKVRDYLFPKKVK